LNGFEISGKFNVVAFCKAKGRMSSYGKDEKGTVSRNLWLFSAREARSRSEINN
jgi:hypothetical protein